MTTAAEPAVFDAWINLPYLPGEVTPDPSVVARFKRGNSAYEGGETIADVLLDDDRRNRLAEAALARAKTLTWEASARGVLQALHDQVMAKAAKRST